MAGRSLITSVSPTVPNSESLQKGSVYWTINTTHKANLNETRGSSVPSYADLTLQRGFNVFEDVLTLYQHGGGKWQNQVCHHVI